MVDPEKPIRFSPVEDFFSEQFGSHYCAGLSYTASVDNAPLRDAAVEWEGEGKVVFIASAPADASLASMGGAGQIQD